MIYFLQGEHTRLIKIGFTARFIHSRMGALQIGSPDKLIFLGARPGDEKTEYKLHNMFREHHSHGEWFNESSELTSYIKKYCIRDLDVAQCADSLVSSGVEDYEFILTLDYEEIKSLYMSHIVKKLG